jgi:hypothetical protein
MPRPDIAANFNPIMSSLSKRNVERATSSSLPSFAWRSCQIGVTPLRIAKGALSVLQEYRWFI